MKKLLAALALAGAMAALQPALADDAIKIALVHGLSGSPLETYSKQTTIGFNLGLEYATKGTMTVKGHKIEIIEKDTQFKPDVARSMLEEAYNDDDALFAVGGTSSGVTTALLPIAAENQKILVVEPAVADSLTGPNSNRYIFKTSRNSSQDMQAQALALKPDKDLYIATLAQDYAFGKDGIAAFKTAL
ncbi:MAG: ABC transporter substrate-binding protein, partial [Rhizobiaceae bacterium]